MRKRINSVSEIPKFKSEDEERAWWAGHDFSENFGSFVKKLKIISDWIPACAGMTELLIKKCHSPT